MKHEISKINNSFKLQASSFKTRGFTMIEVLVILGVTTFLMSILILYSRVGERQILLLRERARLVNTILRSKALAIQTFQQPAEVCGYGVHFETNRYILFKDTAADCLTSDKKYSGSAEDVEIFQMENVKLTDLTVTDILFIPPDPITLLVPAQTETIITVATLDGSASVKIKVNNAGQVTMQ